MRIAQTCFVIAFLLPTAAVASVPSSSDVKQADLRVHVERRALVRAEASKDAVTIATARASLEAAKAVAWSRKHPAPAPTLSR